MILSAGLPYDLPIFLADLNYDQKISQYAIHTNSEYNDVNDTNQEKLAQYLQETTAYVSNPSTSLENMYIEPLEEGENIISAPPTVVSTELPQVTPVLVDTNTLVKTTTSVSDSENKSAKINKTSRSNIAKVKPEKTEPFKSFVKLIKQGLSGKPSSMSTTTSMLTEPLNIEELHEISEPHVYEKIGKKSKKYLDAKYQPTAPSLGQIEAPANGLYPNLDKTLDPDIIKLPTILSPVGIVPVPIVPPTQQLNIDNNTTEKITSAAPTTTTKTTTTVVNSWVNEPQTTTTPPPPTTQWTTQQIATQKANLLEMDDDMNTTSGDFENNDMDELPSATTTNGDSDYDIERDDDPQLNEISPSLPRSNKKSLTTSSKGRRRRY
jgi:hypothetical protein